MTFNIEKARQAGKTDEEIFNYLSTQKGYEKNFTEAAKRGYQPTQILDYAMKQQAKEPEESGIQKFNRYLGQIPSGAIVASTWPGSVSTALGTADAIQEFEELQERLPRLKKLFPQAPWGDLKELDEEKYMEAVQKAQETGPTPENIIKSLEDVTGLPLEAKTKGQRFLRYLVEAGALSKGSAASKAHKSLKAGAYSSALQAVGVPETVADMYGLGAAQYEFPTLKGGDKLKALFSKGKSEVPPGEGSDEIGQGGGGESPPVEFNILPEHELLEKVTPILEEELSTRTKAIGRPPEIPNFKVSMPIKPEPINELNLQRSIGEDISKVRIPNRTAAASALKSEINDMSRKAYDEVSKLYKTARESNKSVSTIRPKMVKELEDLLEEVSQAGVPSKVQKDIKQISKKYLNLAGNATEGFKEVPNSSLIAQIESNNQKILHDYVQGRPSNQYIRLNRILGDAIEGTSSIAPKAVEAHNAARSAYRNWAQEFGSSELLPWRDPANVQSAKLLKKIEDVDQLMALRDTLKRTKKGQVLFDSVKRDFIERKLKPFIKDPTKTGSIDFEDLMREITPITTPKQRDAIVTRLENASEPIKRFERQSIRYNAAKSRHSQIVDKVKKEIKEWNEKALGLSKNWPYKSDSSILRDLTTVRGLKRLERSLPKTKQGKEMLAQLKDYASTRLLTQGKIVPSDKAESLRKILNDVDKKALLNHTLGKSVTNDLQKIVNNVPKIDAKMLKMQKWLRISKNAGKFIPGVRGPISQAEAVYDTWKMFRPSATKTSYETMDMNVLQSIIENRKDLIL